MHLGYYERTYMIVGGKYSLLSLPPSCTYVHTYSSESDIHNTVKTADSKHLLSSAIDDIY
jgi:hypothetical protein